MKQWKYALVACSVFCLVNVAVAEDNAKAEAAVKQVVLKTVKFPESVKWGKFSLAGKNGACLTVYSKNPLTGLVGPQEAFMLKKNDVWTATYILETPSGHEGCIAEMARQ